jgi:hypothetical protein
MAPVAPAANAHLAEAESLIDGINSIPLGISSYDLFYRANGRRRPHL